MGSLMQAHELDEAASVFEDQLAMHRDNPGLLNNLGLVYKKKEETDRAVSLFEKALALDPSYTKARLNLAGALLSKGAKQAAISHLETIVRDYSSTPESEKAKQILDRLRSR